MSTKNYNSFPEAPEVLIDVDGEIHLIRKFYFYFIIFIIIIIYFFFVHNKC
jgi:hypothetical protein